MKLNQALEEKKLDLRLRDRLLSEGKISEGDIQSYLKNLEDDASNFITIDKAQKETNE